MSATCKEILEAFWQAMNGNDFRRAGQVLDEGHLLDYPQSGELVRGRDNWIALNEEYSAAGRWSFQVHRIVADDRNAVSEVTVSDTATRFRLISFAQVRDGCIRRTTEYWPDPFEPPAMRSHLVEISHDSA